MNKFIKLTQRNEIKVFVNADHIDAFGVDEEGVVNLRMAACEEVFYCLESPAEIYELIEGVSK